MEHEVAHRRVEVAVVNAPVGDRVDDPVDDLFERPLALGRTGRAGNEGEAVSLVCVDELKLLKDIEKMIKRDIPKVKLKGFEVDPSIAPEPIQQRSAGRGGNRGRGGSGGGGSRPKSTTSATRQDSGHSRGSARPAAKHRSRDSHRGNR